MKILDKYLLKKIIKSSVFSLITLVIIFAFFQFLDELEDVGKFSYDIGNAALHVFLLLPSFVNSLFILGIMIGTVLAVGDLNSNKELQIFQAASISSREIVLKILKIGLLLSVFFLFFTELIYPPGIVAAQKIKNESLHKEVVKDSKIFWIKKGGDFIFLKKNSNDEKFKSVSIFKTNNEYLENVQTSDNIIVAEDSLQINNHNKFEINSSKNFSSINLTRANSETIKIPLKEDQIEIFKLDVRALSINNLIEGIIYALEADLNFSEFLIELSSRLIKPFILLGMVLVATPFILDFTRSTSIGKRIFLSLFIAVSTHLIIKISSVVSLKFQMFTYIGPVLSPIILVFVGIILIKKRLA